MSESDRENELIDSDVSASDSEVVSHEYSDISDGEYEVASEYNSDVSTEVSDTDNTQHEFTSKSGRIWSTKPLEVTRRLKRNIVTGKPGPTKYASTAKSNIDFLELFLTKEMKSAILNFSNEHAKKVYEIWNIKHPNLPRREWDNFTETEFDAFLGLLILAGVYKSQRENIKDIWSKDESIRRNIFTATLSRERFQHFIWYLRFDDKSTRRERLSTDKLAHIRHIWDLFVLNCKRAFTPYETVTVDEQLVSFRGRCSFKQYIKSKPARYGLKIWAAADVKTSYLYNLQVYTGKKGNHPEKKQGERIVKDLIEPMYGTGRGITVDNFFTSAPLAEFLLEKKITLLGTVRKNKPDTPKELNIYKNRQEYSSLFVFTKNLTMVSYMPKKNKMVHVLSSQHQDTSISDREDKKPIMILDYNATKGAVDNADKLIGEYSTVRGTRRWPLRLFMHIIDVCALNAFIIYKIKYPPKKSTNQYRKHFLISLGKDLTLPQIKNRYKSENFSNRFAVHIRRAIIACLPKEYVKKKNISTENASKKRGRCAYCPRQEDKKSATKCGKCGVFLCNQHKIDITECKRHQYEEDSD